MKALDPTDNHRIFRDFLAAHDIEGLVSRYSEGAVIIGPGRVRFTGHEGIRQAIEQIVPSIVSVEFELVDLVQVGDVAYERLASKVVVRAPDGTEQDMIGSSYVVLERSADGNWLITIDDMDQ